MWLDLKLGPVWNNFRSFMFLPKQRRVTEQRQAYHKRLSQSLCCSDEAKTITFNLLFNLGLRPTIAHKDHH